MSRNIYVQISGRNEPGYPTTSHEVTFEKVEDLIEKIDLLIEQTGFRKVDVVADDQDEVLNEEEIETLEVHDIFLA